MMEETLRSLLQKQGWFLVKRTRGKRLYFYAQKWKTGEVYITSENKLPDLTEEQVLTKLPVTK